MSDAEMCGTKTLLDFLKEHATEINYVALQYVWTAVHYIESDNHYVTEEGKPLYGVFTADCIDIAQSYFGDLEGAMRFADECSAWDYTSCAELENGIVHGRCYNSVMFDYLDLEDMEANVTNFRYRGLALFRNGSDWHLYRGPYFPTEGY